MNKDQALKFLYQYQPMPAAEELPDSEYEALLDNYNEVLNYFESNPCEESIRPFLNSFGDTDGYGVYDEVCTFMYCFKIEQIVEPLLEAMKSSLVAVRYWAASIAIWFVNSGDCRIVQTLLELLDDSDIKVRDTAVCALSRYDQIGDYSKTIKNKYQHEQSEIVKETYSEYFKDVT